jgi:hypothetical protein
MFIHEIQLRPSMIEAHTVYYLACQFLKFYASLYSTQIHLYPHPHDLSSTALPRSGELNFKADIAH